MGSIANLSAPALDQVSLTWIQGKPAYWISSAHTMLISVDSRTSSEQLDHLNSAVGLAFFLVWSKKLIYIDSFSIRITLQILICRNYSTSHNHSLRVWKAALMGMSCSDLGIIIHRIQQLPTWWFLWAATRQMTKCNHNAHLYKFCSKKKVWLVHMLLDQLWVAALDR